MHPWLLKSLLLPLSLAIGTAYAPQSPDYTELDASGEPLKTAFNNDTGKVRVIMLVAPT